MSKYHKIQTVFFRDPETKFRTLIDGAWATPEFEYLQYNPWIWTEKVDGTNIRVMWDGVSSVQFRGKTDNAQIYAPLVNRLQEQFPAERLSKKFKVIQVCLYGEGFGAKIQKGGGNYKSDGVDFVLFDVRVGSWWLLREDVEDVAKFFQLPIVPTIGRGTLSEMVLKARCGFKSNWGNFPAEGIVARPEVELSGRGGERVITKVKTKDFRV